MHFDADGAEPRWRRVLHIAAEGLPCRVKREDQPGAPAGPVPGFPAPQVFARLLAFGSTLVVTLGATLGAPVLRPGAAAMLSSAASLAGAVFPFGPAILGFPAAASVLPLTALGLSRALGPLRDTRRDALVRIRGRRRRLLTRTRGVRPGRSLTGRAGTSQDSEESEREHGGEQERKRGAVRVAIHGRSHSETGSS